MKRLGLWLALTLLLLPGHHPACAQGDAQALRRELFNLVNEARQEAGAPPLRLSEPLTRAAQWHAGEISRQGRLQAGSPEAMRERIKKAGYDAHSWTENISASTGSPATVLRNWRRGDNGTFRKLLDPEVRDIGIGLDELRGTPLYTFLYAVPQGDYFTRATRDLRDLEQIRAEMLARVSAERRRAGAAPLGADSLLDKAAQQHAEDMLARSYFAHQSPEGKSVRERARSAGYEWRTIGENIAEGQLSVDEVMDTWMKSPGHRRNILSPDFQELGIGLALGRSQGSYRILWAQAFGTPPKR